MFFVDEHKSPPPPTQRTNSILKTSSFKTGELHFDEKLNIDIHITFSNQSQTKVKSLIEISAVSWIASLKYLVPNLTSTLSNPEAIHKGVDSGGVLQHL